MSSVILQKSVKDNSEELQDFLMDLRIWEKDIKKEDIKLIEKQRTIESSNLEEILPIRNKTDVVQEPLPPMTQNHDKHVRKKTQTRISSCDYDAWEKFDVDEALNSGSEEETDALSENAQQKSTLQTQKENVTRGKEGKKTIQQKQHSSSSVSQTAPNDLSSQSKERAEKLKEEGNMYYSKGNLSDAIAKYTQGIGLNPSNPILPANRAMAYIKLKKFKAAEKDCSKALQLDPKYIKAYLRRATTRVHLANYPGAIKDYEKVLQLEPWNKDAKKELEKLERSSVRVANKNCRNSLEEPAKDGDNKKMKKLKVEEFSSYSMKGITNEDPSIIPAITKPIYLQSTKPLTDIPVVEVNSKEEMEALLNEAKMEPVSSSPVVAKMKPPAEVQRPPEKKDVWKPSVPNPPKTSHQFSQDWRKVVKFEDLAISYLKSIPLEFFHGMEIEVDHLVEVVHTLCSDSIDDVTVAPIMTSLIKCRGFFLNIAFLETKQNEIFEKLLMKMENCEAFKEELKQLKDVL